MSGDKTIRVTGQAGLDEALAKPSSDDVVIVIDSHPGDFIPNYVFVMDSRGHAVEACGEVACGCVGPRTVDGAGA